MLVGIRRVLVAIVVTLTLSLGVRPAVCGISSIFSPITSAVKIVSKTTTKVAKTSVATIKKVAAAPKNLLTKVSKTVTRKKTK